MSQALDYDRIELWGSWVNEAVSRAGGDVIVGALRSAPPKYVETARDELYDRLGRAAITNEILVALVRRNVRLYHGTRLTDEEIHLVEQHGLIPLDLPRRAHRVMAILAKHERWGDVAHRFPEAIRKCGPEGREGTREDGCVHACFSRTALVEECDHYLATGAEVDIHVAHHVFGDGSGEALLRRERVPLIVSFEVAFDEAARGCRTGRDLDAARQRVVDKLLGAWVSTVTHPNATADFLSDCWATKIQRSIPPSALVIERLTED